MPNGPKRILVFDDEFQITRVLKRSLDPKNLLNPGKVI